MCIKDLDIQNSVRNNAYTFFSLDRTKTQHVYRYYSTQNIIEISHPSGANIHISKCYSAKYYSAKCCKGKKFEIFLGIDFLCVKINLSHKQSHRVTDDLRSITYYIICTLTRIENVLIYVAHANMHCDWTIYYFIKTIFGIWVKD